MAVTNHHSDGDALPCAMRAWNANEKTLALWLYKQTQDKQRAHDILQEVFIRVMGQGSAFCDVENSKAWMFRVAHNLIIDLSREPSLQLLADDIEESETSLDAVDLLAISCLPRVLSELEQPNREIITACDLQGMNQQDFAIQHGLSLPATKSRIRRAREKLRHQLSVSCKVKFDENHQVCCFTRRENGEEKEN